MFLQKRWKNSGQEMSPILIIHKEATTCCAGVGFFTYTLAPFLLNITSNRKTCTISHLSEQIDKNVLLTPMPYLCLALPLSKHTGTHGVQNMLNKKICESLGNNFSLNFGRHLRLLGENWLFYGLVLWKRNSKPKEIIHLIEIKNTNRSFFLKD
jgi:hypothetical protein